MNAIRTSACDRTVHSYTGWAALPPRELTALRQAALTANGTENPALVSELLALIDRELAKRGPRLPRSPHRL